jgi:hypothetical protein
VAEAAIASGAGPEAEEEVLLCAAGHFTQEEAPAEVWRLISASE